MMQLVQTANGRYNVADVNLNDLVGVQPMGLRSWLQSVWNQAG